MEGVACMDGDREVEMIRWREYGWTKGVAGMI